MQEFIAKHQDKIAGTLSGFDRLVFRALSENLEKRAFYAAFSKAAISAPPASQTTDSRQNGR